MPSRAKRAPKKNSVAMAVKRNLIPTASTRVNTKSKETVVAATPTTPTKVTASRSRVSRRKQELVPQEAPEWQQQALKTAAAEAKLRKITYTNERSANSRINRTVSKAKATKEKGEERNMSDAADKDDTVSAASAGRNEASADTSAGRMKKKAVAAKRQRGSVEEGTATKRAKKPKVSELLCPQCKLRIDQWPFCGLSGDAHVVPELAVPGFDSAAASPTTANEEHS